MSPDVHHCSWLHHFTIMIVIELSNNHVLFMRSHKSCWCNILQESSDSTPLKMTKNKWMTLQTLGNIHIWFVRWLLKQVVCCIVRMGVTAGCTVLHYVTPAANFYPSALPRFWRNPLFIRDVGHPVETAGTLHPTSSQRQPILLLNLNKKEKRIIFYFFCIEWVIHLSNVRSHIWLFNKMISYQGCTSYG